MTSRFKVAPGDSPILTSFYSMTEQQSQVENLDQRFVDLGLRIGDFSLHAVFISTWILAIAHPRPRIILPRTRT